MDKTIMLIHGAHHGGWSWRKTVPLLRAKGYEVYTPTLTGLGERAHLLTSEVGLSTMIQDIVAVIEREELTDVLLVGHSFGAIPVLGAADRIPDKIDRIVLLDGIVVEGGRCGFDALPHDIVVQRKRDARPFGGSMVLPPPPAATFGVTDAEDAAWIERHITPQPLRCYEEPLQLDAPLGANKAVTYIYCTNPSYPAIASSHQIVRKMGWTFRELATGHNAMVTDPEGTVEAILS